MSESELIQKFTEILGVEVLSASLLDKNSHQRSELICSYMIQLADTQQILVYELQSPEPETIVEIMQASGEGQPIENLQPVDASPTSAKQNMPVNSQPILENIYWAYPEDPLLISLKAIVDTEAIVNIFARLNLCTDINSLELISYRPLKSAVTRVGTPEGNYFLKSLAKDKVELFFHQNKLLAEHQLPVPELIAWTEDGLVVTKELAGISALNLFNTTNDSLRLFNAVESLLDKINSLPLPPEASTGKTPISHRSRNYLRSFKGTPLELRASKLIETIEEIQKAQKNDSALVGQNSLVVHGDLHLEQFFYDENFRLTGVLDFDRMTIGNRVDDYASLIGFETYREIWINKSSGENIEPRIWPIKGMFEDKYPEDALNLRVRIAAVLVAHAASALSEEDESLVDDLFTFAEKLLH